MFCSFIVRVKPAWKFSDFFNIRSMNPFRIASKWRFSILAIKTFETDLSVYSENIYQATGDFFFSTQAFEHPLLHSLATAVWFYNPLEPNYTCFAQPHFLLLEAPCLIYSLTLRQIPPLFHESPEPSPCMYYMLNFHTQNRLEMDIGSFEWPLMQHPRILKLFSVFHQVIQKMKLPCIL